MAVILGPVSGDMVCRDYDLAESYERWKQEFPTLAVSLPTVKTSRGYHVYFRCSGIGIERFTDGELRGAGHYCLLPPSILAKGSGRYEWIVPLPNDEDLPLIDPIASGLMGKPSTSKNIKHSANKEYKEYKEYNGVMGNVLKNSIILTDEIETIINQNLPLQIGERNDRLFDLARELKSLPGCWNADPEHFQILFDRWYERAKPNIETKDRSFNWNEFLCKWKEVKYPKGIIIEKVFQQAQETPTLKPIYEDDHLNILLEMCKILQDLLKPKTFYLGTPTLGRLFNVDPKTAWRWLGFLERQGWIQTAKKGNINQANHYQFIKKLDSDLLRNEKMV
jgi:hypothetical protein